MSAQGKPDSRRDFLHCYYLGLSYTVLATLPVGHEILVSLRTVNNRQFSPGNHDTAFSLFCTLWAAATLFHMASFGKLGTIYHFLLGLSAIWLLFRPSSCLRLLLLAGFQLYEVWTHLPVVSNHWLFTAFVNFIIIFSFASLALSGGTWHVGGDALFKAFAPMARWSLMILYFFAVFHKLNSDYFSHDVSCGAHFYRMLAERFSFIPESTLFEYAAIYGTIIVEALIPLLLIARHTRSAGIIVGILFHSLIAIHPMHNYYNFGSMLLAMFSLFAPASVVPRVAAFLEDTVICPGSEWLRKTTTWVKILGALAGGALCIVGLELLRHILHDRDYFVVLFLLYSGALLSGFVCYLWITGGKEMQEPGALRAPLTPAVVLPVLLFANGLLPYLGLKTESSFAMFSNLRTEGGRSNHLLMPESLHWFSFQQDLIEVVSSSDPKLQWLADEGLLVTFFEFRDLLSRRPEASVSYIRDHVRYDVERAADDPEITQAHPRITRKLLRFRPITKEGRQECRH